MQKYSWLPFRRLNKESLCIVLVERYFYGAVKNLFGLGAKTSVLASLLSASSFRALIIPRQIVRANLPLTWQ